jgi:acetyl esterase/lipase
MTNWMTKWMRALITIFSCAMAGHSHAQIIESTLPYRTVGDRELTTLVFEPQADATAGDKQRPAVVFFHGGGWVGGQPRQFSPFARDLAARGAVCFSAEYRLIQDGNGVTPQDCLDDAVAMMRYVREHAELWNIDPGRIAVGGGSAGGHLAASLVTLIDEPDLRPAALLLYNPALDLSEDGWQGGAKQVKKAGGDPIAFSPAHHVDVPLPPTLIFHGSADPVITIEAIRRFRDRAAAVGSDITLDVFEGRGHGFFNVDRDTGDFEQIVETSAAFLERHGLLPAGVNGSNGDS